MPEQGESTAIAGDPVSQSCGAQTDRSNGTAEPLVSNAFAFALAGPDATICSNLFLHTHEDVRREARNSVALPSSSCRALRSLCPQHDPTFYARPLKNAVPIVILRATVSLLRAVGVGGDDASVPSKRGGWQGARTAARGSSRRAGRISGFPPPPKRRRRSDQLASANRAAAGLPAGRLRAALAPLPMSPARPERRRTVVLISSTAVACSTDVSAIEATRVPVS